jgi:hypothetical protein
MNLSKTNLSILAAVILSSLSIGVAVTRRQALGEETHMPRGPGNYLVTLLVRGEAVGDAKLLTACPLDFGHQHIFGEDARSTQLFPKLVESKTGDRRHLHWTLRAGAKGPLEARYVFHCVTAQRANGSMNRLNKQLHAAPKPGEFLHGSPGIDPSHAAFTETALTITPGLLKIMDQARALYQFVTEKIQREPSPGQASPTALECLQAERGDALAQSRLLVALCRNRGIPARLVHGLVLHKNTEQNAHVWVEAWAGDHWMAMCPLHHHCGRVPPSYLVFGYEDFALVRGFNIAELDSSFLVQPQGAAAPPPAESPVKRFFQRISLFTLPPAESRLVEFLLLLPVSALIICFFRNIIGLPSFGTFAPGLIGLAFREFESLPGVLVFVAILLIGWCLRRGLDRFHLLQVPRTSLMLSLVVVVLIALIVAANYRDLAATRYISLFPMIILTGMIERFWTLESEDGAWSSFKTLFCTLLIAATISLLLSIPGVVRHLMRYPETIGLVMAGQLLIGRYTGYRLSELWRFRDLVTEQPLAA